ncbi:crossover junction endodeoxyribonuclease RuvC [Serinibacter salmoneus]|uniref:crossover junction endodeoxyribonuclease RuvC n=1 Tax=Serinibacter salmoneus TaxID=556530 RepID=UPI000BF43AEB|nr:crossover junction endodeoxyribonuclease RuvC [Serinibacter salmoneus]
MTILGVDPGLTRCGLAAVYATPDRAVRIRDVGVATSEPGEELAARLVRVADEIEAWLDRLQPDAVAVERVFAQSNVSTVASTAQVAGLAMVAAQRRGLPVTLHTPSEVKAAVTGNGRAGKEQVATMVARILGVDKVPRPADATDALALAICHAWRGSPATGVSEGSGDGTAAQRAWREAARRAARSPRRVAAARPTVGR